MKKLLIFTILIATILSLVSCFPASSSQEDNYLLYTENWKENINEIAMSRSIKNITVCYKEAQLDACARYWLPKGIGEKYWHNDYSYILNPENLPTSTDLPDNMYFKDDILYVTYSVTQIASFDTLGLGIILIIVH